MARWVTDKYIYLMLAAMPLFILPDGYVNITQAKFYCFVVLTLAWLTALLFAVIRERSFVRPRAVQLSAAAFLVIAAVSSAVSGFGFWDVLIGCGRYDGLATSALYVAVFLGVTAFAKRKISYIYAFSSAMLLSCAVAAVQLTGANPLALYPSGWNYYDAGTSYSSAYLGLTGNTDILGALLCLSIPLGLLGFISGEGRLAPRCVMLISAGASIFILLMSGVSGALLATVGSLIISMPTFLGALRGKPFGKSTHIIYIAALLLLAFVGLVGVYFTHAERGTVYELSQILHGNIDGRFGSSRVMIWRELLRLFTEKPLLGGGSGTLAQRIDISFSRYVPETGKTLSTYVDNAHSVYLGILADNGALGLAAYLAAIILSLFRFFSGRCDCLRCVFGAAFISGCIEAAFGLGLCLSQPVFILVWALFEAQDDSSITKDPSGG